MLSACGQGHVHGQMQLEDRIPIIEVAQMETGKYDTITITGHNLGAGTAALLGILLNTPMDSGGAGFEGKVRVFGYGTPPVVCDTEDEGKFISDTKKIIVSVINQHDLISRIATQHMSAYVWCCNNANFMDELTGQQATIRNRKSQRKKWHVWKSGKGWRRCCVKSIASCSSKRNRNCTKIC